MTARYVLEFFLMLEVLMYPGPVIDVRPQTFDVDECAAKKY
jgi:hypothetical protein